MASVLHLPATVFTQNWLLACTHCYKRLWHPGEWPRIYADRQGDEFVVCPNCRRLYYAVGGTFERPDVPTPLGLVRYSQATDADGHVAVQAGYEIASSMSVYLVHPDYPAPLWRVTDIGHDHHDNEPVADGLTLDEAIERALGRCAQDDSY